MTNQIYGNGNIRGVGDVIWPTCIFVLSWFSCQMGCYVFFINHEFKFLVSLRMMQLHFHEIDFTKKNLHWLSRLGCSNKYQEILKLGNSWLDHYKLYNLFIITNWPNCIYTVPVLYFCICVTHCVVSALCLWCICIVFAVLQFFRGGGGARETIPGRGDLSLSTAKLSPSLRLHFFLSGKYFLKVSANVSCKASCYCKCILLPWELNKIGLGR